MKYRMPDYYKNFKCIADKCPMTCCEGWAIVIDDKSLEKYVDCSNSRYICKHIDQNEKIFLQNGSRCSFLNRSNLCDLYNNVGEDYLCKTCRRYPRHFENYGSLIEAALSMSCPEAAKLILSKNNHNKYRIRDNSYIVRKDKEVDNELLETLLFVRKTVFKIMKQNDSFEHKMIDILWLSEGVQKKLFEYEKLGIKNKITYYKKKYFGAIKEYCNNISKQDNSKIMCGLSRKTIFKSYIDMLKGLEKINDNWPKDMDYITSILYDSNSDEEYIELCRDFEAYMESRYYEYDNIFNYFVYTYLLGSVYDYNIQAMIKFSLLCTLIIKEWGMAKWLENNKVFSKEDNEKICYLFSRQIEHSDNNLMSLEGILSAHPMFCFENMVQVIRK